MCIIVSTFTDSWVGNKYVIHMYNVSLVKDWLIHHLLISSFQLLSCSPSGFRHHSPLTAFTDLNWNSTGMRKLWKGIIWVEKTVFIFSLAGTAKSRKQSYQFSHKPESIIPSYWIYEQELRNWSNTMMKVTMDPTTWNRYSVPKSYKYYILR